MNVREEALVWVRLGSLLAIWVALLYLSRIGLAINWTSLKQLPAAVTAYVILSYASSKWLWRLPILQGWLVPFPDLQGIWQGEIKSTWTDPKAHQALHPISAILVIRQDFFSISCAMHTKESDSYSAAALISVDDESGRLRLSFNYTNKPKVMARDRMAIHYGAAILQIGDGPTRMLQGEYWTSRRTTGEILLKFRSRTLFPNPLD
jgi:predicted pore-forming effector associated with SMODS systems